MHCLDMLRDPVVEREQCMHTVEINCPKIVLVLRLNILLYVCLELEEDFSRRSDEAARSNGETEERSEGHG